MQTPFKLQSYAGTMVLLVMKLVECNRSVDEVGEKWKCRVFSLNKSWMANAAAQVNTYKRSS